MQNSADKCYDVVVIGGGINGASIAADAAGRGLSVALFEQHDLASGTSSYSSKLIHGGLRYLEQYDFKLVRHALAEREIWLKRAPHLIEPMAFILPYEKHLRPKWMLRMGLWLYDHLAKRKMIPGSRGLRRDSNDLLQPLNQSIQYGFSYYDCFCDDARLVIEIAKQAKQHNADVFVRHQVTEATLNDSRTHWDVTVLNQTTMTTHQIHGRALINAAGPWMEHVAQQVIEPCHPYQCQLIKGSHIVVPKLYQGPHAYILQNADNRIVFVIPYQHDYSLIGTTDVVYHDKPENASISNEEIDYLTAIIKHYFNKSIQPNDIVNHFSGVRPLLHEPNKPASQVSRDYEILVDKQSEMAPLLTITGGKLTTARRLAEDTVNKLKPYFNHMQASWTANESLPGGNLHGRPLDTFTQDLLNQYPQIDQDLLSRYAHLYGSHTYDVLQSAQETNDLGQLFGADCYQREIDYLVEHEWAYSTDDILWRRTKLGLRFSTEQTQSLQHYLESKHATPVNR